MTTKTKMLSTDSDSSSRYAAKYSVAALLPWVAATHSPSASPSPTHTMTHAMCRDQGTSASVLGRRAAGLCGSGRVRTIAAFSLREGVECFLHDSADFVSYGCTCSLASIDP